MKTCKVLIAMIVLSFVTLVYAQRPSLGIGPEMELQVFGHTNNYYRIESSTNLADWISQETYFSISNTPYIQPIGTTNKAREFFRAIALFSSANYSYPDPDAEHDNLNIPLMGDVTNFSIIATHPFAYQPTNYNLAADFSGAPTNEVTTNYYFSPTLYTIHFVTSYMLVEREASWWTPQGITVTLNGSLIDTNIHHIYTGKEIPDNSGAPEYFDIYCDGNVRLIPFPPIGQSNVSFGISIIVGPAPVDANRPFVDIESIDIRSVSQTLFVTYRTGGTAIIDFSTVTRTNAILKVTVNYPTDKTFCTFRSMFAADGNSDCDHVWWRGIDGLTNSSPVMSFSGTVGTEWFFYRQTISSHNQSAPDIRIVIN